MRKKVTHFRVLVSLTRKFKLHESVSLSKIAKRCPPNFTGADMYALCTDAWFHAAKRKVWDAIIYIFILREIKNVNF